MEKAVVLSDADHPAMVLLRTESGYTTNAAIQDAAASYIYIDIDIDIDSIDLISKQCEA